MCLLCVYHSYCFLSIQAEKEINVNKSKGLLKQNLDKAKERHGTVPVRFLKLLFVGSTAAGKTSFINLLLKKRFDGFHQSTNIVHATHTVSTIDVESSEVVWNKLDSAFEIDYLHSMILPKLLVALQEPSSAMETQSSRISTEKDPLSSEVATLTLKYKSVTPKQSSIQQLFTKFFENPVKWSNLSSFDRITDATVPDFFVHQSKEVLNIITLLDTGGLPEYMNLLPTLNIYPTVTFIVHNLSKSLNEQVFIEYSQNGRNAFLPYHLNYCNLDMIKYLMSFANDSMQRPTFNISQTSNRNICLVGAHADKVSQQEVAQVESKLIALLNNMQYEAVVWQNDKGKVLFSVDNTTVSDEESTANEIRNRIEMLAREKDTDELPITWMLLVLEIQQTCSKRKTDYISFHDCVLLARETGLMSNKEEIKCVLLYHHQLGVLTYFDEVPSLCDYVIVGQQWWLDRLNNIISITFQDNFVDRPVQKLKQQGLVSKELLEYIGCKDDLKQEFFLSLLVHMRISAPIFTEKKEIVEYFTPFVLPECSFQQSSKVLDQYGYLQGERLLVNLQKGFLPRGMFCSLIVEMLQYLPKKWQPCFSHRGVCHTFRNLIIFQMHKYMILSLSDKISHLEVQIRHPVKHEAICSPVHNEVYDYLVYALKDVCVRLNFDYKSLQYGFVCQCGKGIENHIAVVPDPNSPYYTQCIIDKRCLSALDSSHLAWFHGKLLYVCD